MKYKIKRISPHQAGKVMAVLFAVVSLPFLLIVSLVDISSSLNGGIGMQMSPMLTSFGLLVPLINAIMAYVYTVVLCWLYNLLVGFTGGFEVEIDKISKDVPPSAE